MIDMTQNRVPYGLLTDEEKAALHEHKKAGGEFEYYDDVLLWWEKTRPSWIEYYVYRPVPIPKTQDVIAWDRLPDWVEWVARDASDYVIAFENEPLPATGWWVMDENREARRIDDFPGMVQIGTCDWKDSLQRRPRG